VTQATASPGTGTEHVGDTITLTLGFNEAVTVAGVPTLSLNDGNTAAYVSGSGTSSLTFRTTVMSTDIRTSALAITGVNLPSGASIKDSFGVAANLSGAVKTFTGLQVDPTSTSTLPVVPVLTIADTYLIVAKGGGTVDLGVGVTTTDLNDVVTVNIRGLPRYETITDTLDGQTFKGKNITLTEAQVESGLTLQSNYKGGADPVATLTLTATAKDPVTGAVTSSAPQTITVKDPAPAATTASLTEHSSVTANRHADLIASALTDAPKTIPGTDPLLPTGTGTGTASLASQSFALFNQYLAGHTGRVDAGQIVAVVSHGSNCNQESFLTRPQH
jgi:hypothetical protein